jgi:mercuric ion binding protein
LAFTALGVGAGTTGFLAGAAQFVKALVPYQPLFVGLAFFFLAVGFFSVYRKKADCAGDPACPASKVHRTKTVLWIITGIVLILLLMPYLLAVNVSFSAEIQELQKVTLKVDGISCGSCIAKIRSSLSKVPGVKAVEMKVKSRWIFFADYTDARAIVEFEPSKTRVDELINAVESASDAMYGYKAALIE